MEAQSNTANTVRIDQDMLGRIREISKANGQTIVGYINLKLGKIVEKDWKKLHPGKNEQP